MFCPFEQQFYLVYRIFSSFSCIAEFRYIHKNCFYFKQLTFGKHSANSWLHVTAAKLHGRFYRFLIKKLILWYETLDDTLDKAILILWNTLRHALWILFAVRYVTFIYFIIGEELAEKKKTKFERKLKIKIEFLFVNRPDSVMGTEMNIQDGKNADYMVALNE